MGAGPTPTPQDGRLKPVIRTLNGPRLPVPWQTQVVQARDFPSGDETLEIDPGDSEDGEDLLPVIERE
jgi:hypothetical protein